MRLHINASNKIWSFIFYIHIVAFYTFCLFVTYVRWCNRVYMNIWLIEMRMKEKISDLNMCVLMCFAAKSKLGDGAKVALRNYCVLHFILPLAICDACALCTQMLCCRWMRIETEVARLVMDVFFFNRAVNARAGRRVAAARNMIT